MKHVSLFALLLTTLGLGTSLFSAVNPPVPSLTATAIQKVALTNVSITYARPNVKGRNIFGELVPYGEVWRTGANWATTIEFETDAILEGNNIPAGKYALFTIPNQENWTVILNSVHKQWGAFSYDSSKDMFRFEVPSKKLSEPLESFEIRFANTHDNQTDIVIAWADRAIEFTVSIPDEIIHGQMMASIQEAVIETKDPDWRDLGEAARYYVKIQYELDTAVEWLELCAKANPDAWWMVGERAELLKSLGRNEEAVTAANQMLTKCTDNKNDGGITWANTLLESLGNT